MDHIENVGPVVAEASRPGQSTTTKRHAPLPPTSVSVQEISPLQTSPAKNTVPSPIKMMKVDENVDSPGKVTKVDDGTAETMSSPEDNQIVNTQNNQTSSHKTLGSKLVSNAEEKKGTAAMRHVSSAKLIFGESPAMTYSGAVLKLTPSKAATVQKQGPSSCQVDPVSKASLQTTGDDSMVDEPTMQPVAARLAAWQTKQVAVTNQEPLAVSSRVKNYERKITTELASEKTKSPLKMHSLVESVSNKSTIVMSTKMSPARAGAPVPANSPKKSVLSSPQKISPATRAVQERLTQICEAGTRNVAVDRERKERAAELVEVENRWQQRSPTSAAPAVSY